ncbi:MAG: membrane dipeptidase [Clostridia bacterium]|nr:membrane dipeptidase [Clostridia bacterium]
MQIADFHNDILTSNKFNSLPIDCLENKVVTALFKGDKSFLEILSLTDKSEYIAFEDVGYLDFNFDMLATKNPVYVGITWNGENQFGYGCDYNFGLKRKGVELIKLLNERNIAVDTAHISKKGFVDIIDNAKKVVNSHTCFNGVFRHKRNLDDWQIKLLLERGGLVGLTCCGYFMTNRKTCKISYFIENILYFYERYGADNLCLGTDFFGTDFLVDGLTSYKDFKSLKPLLLKKGMSETDVEKILCKNLTKFLANIGY